MFAKCNELSATMPADYLEVNILLFMCVDVCMYVCMYVCGISFLVRSDVKNININVNVCM